MQAQRFWEERTFLDKIYGMASAWLIIKVRTYKGRDNHIALTSLAMLFVTGQRNKNKEYASVLSQNDVRELLLNNWQTMAGI